MTRITWDETSERRFEVGVDRGVLYEGPGSNQQGFAWPGLRSVDELTEEGSTPYFIDGVKYLDIETLGDFQATIRAFTYPPVLDAYIGVSNQGNGLFIDDQTPQPFHFSYRTRVGNDVDGVEHGYKIHIIWNALLVPQAVVHNTLGADPELVEFAWDLVATPTPVTGFKPTAHLVLDSTQLDPALLSVFENALYGTEVSEAYLPSLEEFATAAGIGFVVYNGDDTWTITAPDANITMISATQFEIVSNAEGMPEYLDADTFRIELTNF